MLDISTILKIRELKEKGYKIKQIAEELGISRLTVYKYASMSDEEIQKLKAELMKREAEKYRPDTLKTIRTAMEENIKNRATLEYIKIHELGEWVYLNITPAAKKLGVKEKDIILEALRFYVNYKNKVENLEDKVRKYEIVIRKLLSLLTPAAEKHRKIQELKDLIIIHLQNNQLPPEEVYKKIFELMGVG